MIPTDFNEQKPVFLEPLRRSIDHLTHEVKPVRSAAKRGRRFEAADIVIKLIVLRIGHIRRIRDGEVEAFLRRDRRPHIANARVDRSAKSTRILACERNRVSNEISRDH